MSILYKEFQYNFICNDINKDTKEKLNGKLDSLVINNTIQKDFFNYGYLSQIKDVFCQYLNNISVENTFCVPYIKKEFYKIIKTINEKTATGDVIVATVNDINVIIKSTKIPSELVIDLSYKYDILCEYFISTRCTNDLRKIVPNFSYAFGCYITDCDTNIKVKELLKTTPPPKFIQSQESLLNKKYCIIYENVIGSSLTQFLKSQVNAITFIKYFISVLFALNVAQNKYDFVHYDLHSENIILKTIPKSDIQYSLDDIDYNMNLSAIPTLIDYGYSHIIHKEVPIGMFTRKNLGLDPIYTNTGFDQFKLLYSCLYYWFITNKNMADLKPLVTYYYDKEDIYGLISVYKEGDYKNKERILECFKRAHKVFFSYTANFTTLSKSNPRDYLNFIKDNHFATWIQCVNKIPKTVNKINEIDISCNNTMFYNKIISKTLKLTNCNKYENMYSYILNNYIITNSLNVMNKFNLNNNLKVLQDITTKRESVYKENDKLIEQNLHKELRKLKDNILSVPVVNVNIDFNKEDYFNSNFFELLISNLNKLQKWNDLYEKYISYITISKSTNKYANDDREFKNRFTFYLRFSSSFLFYYYDKLIDIYAENVNKNNEQTIAVVLSHERLKTVKEKILALKNIFYDLGLKIPYDEINNFLS